MMPPTTTGREASEEVMVGGRREAESDIGLVDGVVFVPFSFPPFSIFLVLGTGRTKATTTKATIANRPSTTPSKKTTTTPRGPIADRLI